MIRSLPALALLAFAAVTSPVSAEDAKPMRDALDQACAMMRASDESADALARAYDGQATMFKQADRSGIAQRIRVELSNVNVVRAQLFEVGGVDGFLQDYVVGLAADNYRNVYVFLRYESMREREARLTKFRYFDDFDRIEPQNLLAAPHAVECPSG